MQIRNAVIKTKVAVKKCPYIAMSNTYSILAILTK